MKERDVPVRTLLMHIGAMVNEVPDGGKATVGDGVRRGREI